MARAYVWIGAAVVVSGLAACGSDSSDRETSGGLASSSVAVSSSGAGGSGEGGAGGATASSSVASSVAVGPTVAASGAASSSTGGDPGKEIPCGSFTCPVVCCLNFATKECGFTPEECTQKMLSPMACNDASDCGMDEVCCLEMNFSAMKVEGKCSASCPYKPIDMMNPSAGSYQLCIDPNECPQGLGCKDFKFGTMDTGWDACLP